jgi:Na+/melibiose symporter-like transporter
MKHETHLICLSIFYFIFLRIKQVYKHIFGFFVQDSSNILRRLSKTKLNALEKINLCMTLFTYL